MTTEPKLQAVPDDPDPYNPDAFRMDVLPDIATEKILTAVPVRKPKRDEFFRVRPEDDYTRDIYVLQWEEGTDRITYLVQRDVMDMVPDRLIPVRLFTCVNKRGTTFLWPCKLPTVDNERGRRWAETALVAAEKARTLWCKLYGDMDLGGYQVLVAKGELGEPRWSDRTFAELFKVAFYGRIIDRADHPVIQEITGER